jgi:type IV secretion system protein TrbF
MFMNPAIRQRETRPSPHSEEYNPYLAARREWDERYGDQITRAKNWRTMAGL